MLGFEELLPRSKRKEDDSPHSPLIKLTPFPEEQRRAMVSEAVVQADLPEDRLVMEPSEETGEKLILLDLDILKNRLVVKSGSMFFSSSTTQEYPLRCGATTER